MMDERAFRNLAEVTRAIGASPRFTKILSDATLPVQAKIQLLDDVSGGAVSASPDVVDVMNRAFDTDRPTSVPLPEYLLSLTADAGFEVADRSDRLGAVEDSLRTFADLTRSNADLRFAMTDPGASDSSKEQLVGELLQHKADEIAIVLLRVLIGLTHGVRLDEQVVDLADKAAKKQGHIVADVHTAIELDDSYKSRIASTLTSVVGSRVEPRFVVDPSIVGSIVVRVGDEVWDGSVRQRLEQARIAIVGAQ